MKKIVLILVLLILSGCAIGKKCLYTDEGTVVSSYVWFFPNGLPAEIDKLNCN